MNWLATLLDRIMSKLYPVASTDNETVISLSNEALNAPALSNSSETHNTAPTVSNSTPVAVSSPKASGKSMLTIFCNGIAQMEGANPKNNNEGNCRCSPVGYAPMYGNVKCNPNNFAVFPTKALGRTYLENLVHHRAVMHPNWTFYDFFSNYAPSSDGNDPNHYAKWMANYCGVVPSMTLRELFSL